MFSGQDYIMVWIAMSHSGKFFMKTFDEELKINAEYCKQEILTSHLLPHADRLHLKLVCCGHHKTFFYVNVVH